MTKASLTVEVPGRQAQKTGQKSRLANLTLKTKKKQASPFGEHEGVSRKAGFDIASVSEQKMSELRATFLLFDKDGDGEISPEELCDVLTFLGQEPSMDEVAVRAHKHPTGLVSCLHYRW